MTTPADVFAPAIGACLPCRQIFLVTPETPDCILCGQPPAYTLPFTTASPLVSLASQPEPVEEIPPAAPSEEPSPAVEGPPPAAGEEPSGGHVPAVPSPILALFRGTTEFMEGVTEGPEPLRQLFLEAGAEDEESRVAVGRLVAVRDFVEILWERFEGPSVAPEEPQPETSADEG